MEKLTPEQLDELIRDLKGYQSLESVKDDKDTLQFLRSALFIPKKEVPRPIKKFRFADAESAHMMSTMILRFAAGLFVAVLVLAFTAEGSVPGQKLYNLKKAAEQTRLAFIRDPEARANAQLSLVEKRIHDAQSVLQNTSSDESKAAVLNELAAQTKVAAETVKQATPTVDDSQTNPGLLVSLAKIAEQQEALIDDLNSEDTPEDEILIGSETQTAVDEVRSILATVNDQTLAVIGQNTKEFSGVIEKIDKESLTINNTVITITETTKVYAFDSDQELSISVLIQNMRVEVTAKVSKSGAEAISIELQEKIKPTEVQGVQTPEPNNAEPAIQSTSEANKIIEEQNTTQAGFIYEDPSPAYVP